MRILKPTSEEIELDGKIRHLLFNINVIDEIQDHLDLYIVDAINSIFETEEKEKQKKSYDTTAYIFTVLLNEDIRIHNKKNPTDQWEPFTEEYLKEEILTNSNSGTVAVLILKSFNGSIPKNDGEENPNQKSEHMKK